jgi:hypothetical protein
MRIRPIRENTRSGSSESGGLNSGYEISRRWEDCLWFQDCLELEYERMSRAKRRRLVAGKGVKRNGIYVQKDQASSFASLPPGPHPSSIAKNIHDHVPKLTKKGTLFRENQTTVDQRYRELRACIDGLFKEDVPMLIQELRESRRVTDFFGYWRRDYDLALKEQKDRNPEERSRNSVSSSVFSTYFSASHFRLLMTEGASINSLRDKSTFAHGSSRCSKAPVLASSQYCVTRSDDCSSDDGVYYPRNGSDSSAASPPGPLTSSSDTNRVPSHSIVPHDTSSAYGHNLMKSISEGEDLISAVSGMKVDHGDNSTCPVRKGHGNTADTPRNRDRQVIALDETEGDVSPDASLNRLSWQTSSSGCPTAYLHALDTDLTLPKSPPLVCHFPRGSVTSFASFMTDSFVDAIIPLSTPNDNRHLSIIPRTIRSSDQESTSSDKHDDVLDSFFFGMLHYLFQHIICHQTAYRIVYSSGVSDVGASR